MATVNPFDLLGDNDTEDPSQLIATQQQKIEHKKAPALSAKPAVAVASKLPSKPLPPAQSVREAKTESARGGRGSGRGYGRGRGAGTGFNRDSTNYNISHGNKEVSGAQGSNEEVDARKPSEKRGGGYVGLRGPFRGDHRGGFSNGESYEGERDRPRRAFEHRSGTGRGNEIKREGSGRGNWGTRTDEPAQVAEEVVNEGEKSPAAEKPSREEDAVAGDKEAATNETEKEPEDKEMTLEEYEKVLEEKRKTLQALKTEGRKVDLKEFEAMQQLANKKTNDDVFVKLGSEKDKRKELAEKEERTKKSVNINEFLKHVEGERYYTPGGRGRGRGRGRGSRGGYWGGNGMSNMEAPSIEDPGQFPTLGGK